MIPRTRLLRDDLGTAVRLPVPVRRVVSLVPSLTETLAVSAPGLLVGATDWCSHPPDLSVARVRGTKNPDLTAVVRLAPDLVVTNEEENRPADLQRLREAGLAVWVTVVRSVPGAVRSLGRMLAACGLSAPGWLTAAARAWGVPVRGEPAAAPAPVPVRRAFVAVWRRPWMSLGRDTFAGDVLARLGVRHVFADAAERYPRVELAEARRRGAELVVLPDEPYRFTPERDLVAFRGWQVPVAFVSGRHLTWYGPSLTEAARLLPGQLAAARPAPPVAAGDAGDRWGPGGQL